MAHLPSTATGTTLQEPHVPLRPQAESLQGSLYPALQRLEKEGLITSEWGTIDYKRRARYYRLTAFGTTEQRHHHQRSTQ